MTTAPSSLYERSQVLTVEPPRVRTDATRLVASAYCIATAGGTAMIWFAYRLARTSTSDLHFGVFWAGYLLVLFATVVVGTNRRTTGFARGLILAVFGLVTFLPKFLMSTSGAVYFDEFGHWRHVNDMVAAGHVDVASTYQPIIRYYPGLELATYAVHAVTRLSTWHSGQLVVLAAHIGVLFIVWRLARAFRLDVPVAFGAAIVYSLNASYLYFDTQYGYESLGLPLALAAVACAVFARRSVSNRRAVAWTGLGVICVATVIPTHHISAFVMSATLLLVFVLVPSGGTRGPSAVAQWGPFLLAALAILGTIMWVFVVAPATVDYLQPHLRASWDQFQDLVLGHHAQPGSRHQLFAGSETPLFERGCAFAAQLIASAVAVLALIQGWRDRRDHDRLMLLLPCVLIATAYFVSLPLALTSAGGETAHRIWAYAYLGIALMAAWGWATWRQVVARRTPRLAAAVGLAALAVVAIGNTAAGENVYYRFPGPYAFGTDTRSHTAETFDLASWVDANLGKGARVVTDRDTGEVIAGYTDLVVPAPSDSPVYALYREGDHASSGIRDYLERHQFRYWILDLRIATDSPKQKLFQGYTGPESIDPAALLDAGSGDLLRLVHQTEHYRVFEIR